MKKNIRRRRADSSSDEEDGHGGSGQQDGGDAGGKKKSLAELREEMKQRKARGGIQAASTLEGVAPGAEEAKGKKRPSAAAEDEDEEAERQKSIGEMMESTFTGMRYVKKDDRTPHEKIMEQYIKEKLAAQGLGGKQQGGKDGDGGAGAAVAGGEGAVPSSKLSRQEKLRQITEEIHAKARPESQGYGGEEAAVGEGAPIAYSTGIAEVALPIEFKLRNIEATEAAQRALQEKGKAAPEEIVGNATTNYFHHRREHAIEMRAREGKPPGVFKRPDGEGPSAATTDDQAYQRFHKRGRR